jgi:hypothetical protein
MVPGGELGMQPDSQPRASQMVPRPRTWPWEAARSDICMWGHGTSNKQALEVHNSARNLMYAGACMAQARAGLAPQLQQDHCRRPHLHPARKHTISCLITSAQYCLSASFEISTSAWVNRERRAGAGSLG